MSRTNANIHWAQIFVDALIGSGVKHVCLSPGSRSTPLILAFAQRDNIQQHIILDERSAGYFALGIAKQSSTPVVVVCTSGTAAANYYPAVLEAKYAEVPILVITADRPHVLRGSGANQTMDQIKLYGNAVKWFVDLPVPDAADKEMYLRSIASRAIATTKSVPYGPVHINFPFAKPLQPIAEHELPPVEKGHTPQIVTGKMLPSITKLRQIKQILSEHQEVVIVCGPMSFEEQTIAVEAIAAFADCYHYPIFADILSGLRFSTNAITTYESILADKSNYGPPPKVILFFGAVPTSKYLHEYLAVSKSAIGIRFSASPTWRDDIYALDYVIQADIMESLSELNNLQTDTAINPLHKHFLTLEQEYYQRTTEYLQTNANFSAKITEILKELPPNSQLFLANSMTIRFFDQFSGHIKKLRIAGNRGISGIDGNIATAAGFAASGGFTTLVIGDLAFLHDLGSLLIAQKHNLRIIVLNNSGGGIFSKLPIYQYSSYFEKYFQTPQEVNLEGLQLLFDVRFQRVNSFVALLHQFIREIDISATIVYEVLTDIQKDQEYLDFFQSGKINALN